MTLDSYYTFRALSSFGIFALWGVMMLNGSFAEMISTSLRGTFASGMLLKKSWTGIGPVDFMISALLAFFSTMTNTADLPDLGPYIMGLDLICALMVVNVMTLVEDRRNRKIGPLRSPTFWINLWNFLGAGVILPVYFRLYLERRGKKAKSERMSHEQAQALPFTALWEMITSAPLLLPALFWNDASTQIQYGIVLWALGPLSLSLFQDLLSSFVTSTDFYKGFSKPITVTYWFMGIFSGIIHVGCVAAAPYLIPGLTWSRVYWPNNSAVVPGPTLLIEGATMFFQYDYIVVSLSVLALGFYMLNSETKSLDKTATSYPMLTLSMLTVLFGPGAGLAWLLCNKEKTAEQQDPVVVKAWKD